MSRDESRRALGLTFDGVAGAYEAVRPAYPPRLVDRAIERAALGPASQVLEVGCGTGKLTEMLLDRGLRVEALDPGANLLAIAERRLGSTGAVTFRRGRFEDVDLPSDAYDAVFSATAFHWVDPRVGWRKAAQLLRPAGLLVLLSYVNIRDEQSSPAQHEFVALLRHHAPELAAQWRPAPELEALIAGAEDRRENVSEAWEWVLQGGLERPSLVAPEAAELFAEVEVAYDTHAVEETANQWLDLFRTTALYQRIEVARRPALEEDARRLIEQQSGLARSSLVTVLVTAVQSPILR